MFVNNYKEGEIDVLISQHTGFSNSGMVISKVSEPTYSLGNDLYGRWLVNDGGVSLSSINNPELNIKNPDAPINDVSVPFFFAALFFALFGFLVLVEGT